MATFTLTFENVSAEDCLTQVKEWITSRKTTLRLLFRTYPNIIVVSGSEEDMRSLVTALPYLKAPPKASATLTVILESEKIII